MDLDAYLSERKERIETLLFSYLPAGDGTPACLCEAMAHAVKSGGKRLRPILCLAAAESVGGDPAAVLPAACAVELLHNYTLVHDDLPGMDNDTMRRGRPTVWSRFGEALGILTGDALLTLSFRTLAEMPETSPGLAARLTRELADAAGAAGVIGGQVEDVRYKGSPTRELIDYVFRHKTADLFRAACRIGAIAAGAAPGEIEALSAYAEHLGFAFQIQDDLLDAGKTAPDAKPELSCLDLMGKDRARAWAEERTRQAVDALRPLPGNAEPLRAIARGLLDRTQ